MKPPSKKRKAHVASTTAPKRRKQPTKRREFPTPSPSQSKDESSKSDSESEIRIEENQPVRTEDQGSVRNNKGKHIHNQPPVCTEVPS